MICLKNCENSKSESDAVKISTDFNLFEFLKSNQKVQILNEEKVFKGWAFQFRAVLVPCFVSSKAPFQENPTSSF